MVNPPFYMGVMLFLNLGLRLGETLALTHGDVSLRGGYVTVRRSRNTRTGQIEETKNSKHRLIPLSEALHKALSFWFEINPDATDETPIVRWVHCKQKHPGWKIDGRAMSASHWAKLHRNYCARLGLPTITPHGLRHTYASHTLAKDPDLNSLRIKLGHKEERTTQIYNHVVKSTLLRKVAFSVGGSSIPKQLEQGLNSYDSHQKQDWSLWKGGRPKVGEGRQKVAGT